MKAPEGVDHIIHDRDIREPLFDYLEETYGKIRIIEEKMMMEIPRRYQRNYFKETIR